MKSLLLLFMIVFTVTSIYAQEIPVKANTIVITLSDSTNMHQKIEKILSDKDFSVKSNPKKPSSIYTEPKTFKNARITLTTDMHGPDIYLTGKISIAGQGNMTIEHKGTKGTPIMNAWEEMDKVAKAFGGKLKYEIK